MPQRNKRDPARPDLPPAVPPPGLVAKPGEGAASAGSPAAGAAEPEDIDISAEDIAGSEDLAGGAAPVAGAPPGPPGPAAPGPAWAVAAAGEEPASPLWSLGLERRAKGNALGALQCFAAVVQADPRDRQAWHELAVTLRAADEKHHAIEALGALGQAHAEAGHLPLAIVMAKELEPLNLAASRRLVERLAGLYSAASVRLERGQRVAPPALPARTEAEPAPLPEQPATREQILKAVERALDAAAEQVQSEPTLPAYPLFDVLSAELAAQLITLMRPREVAAGSVIIEEGNPGDGVYFVARGEVCVTRRGTVLATLGEGPACPIDPPVELARLHEGAFFGEMALVARTPRSASVTATEPTTLLELSTEHVDRMGLASPAFAAGLASYCRARLLANLLTTSPLFQKLPAEGRSLVVERFRPRIYDPEQVVLAEGTAPERASLFLVASGLLEVQKDDGGEALTLARLGPGEVFGEISLIRHSAVTATVRARVRSVVLELSREDFDHVGQAFPQLLAHVYQLAGMRERDLAEVLGGQVLSAEDLLI